MRGGLESDAGSPTRFAITAVFALAGLAFSSWYARLPQIQAGLSLDPTELGFALAGAPIGLLAAQPLVGAAIARHGSFAVVVAAPLYLATVVLPALAGSGVALFFAVLVTGAANGALDVSMNTQGIAVERRLDRRIFNSLHAAFAFGALAGAALAAGAVSVGLSPLSHLALIGGVGGVLAAAVISRLIRDGGRPAARLFARPTRRLGMLGVIAFCALLAEGSVFDWSSIFMVDETGAAATAAPLALAAFSLALGAGRLFGDGRIDTVGAGQLARAGGILGATGLGLAIAFASPGLAIVGFALTGLGISILFPLAMRAASVEQDPPGAELAAVASVGYIGFLVGPPAIGISAGLTDLRIAFLIPFALCLLAGYLATHLDHPRSA